MKWFFVLLLALFVLSGCKEEEKQVRKPVITQKQIQEPMMVYNKEMMAVEDQQIDDYLKRRNWDFQRTETGLRYYIMDEGFGLKPLPGQTVQLKYKVSLIRGEEIYNSEVDGPKVFVVDKSEEVSGLHQMVQLMKLGATAKVVVPSYLAYGIPGDGEKVPRKATLFYEITLEEISN
jgi:FKBP-type peptidyl-prolyl cis-trans isomerase